MFNKLVVLYDVISPPVFVILGENVANVTRKLHKNQNYKVEISAVKNQTNQRARRLTRELKPHVLGIR